MQMLYLDEATVRFVVYIMRHSTRMEFCETLRNVIAVTPDKTERAVAGNLLAMIERLID